MEIFMGGWRIVGALLQIAGVFAVAICGGVLIVSAVVFVVGGVMKFWFDADMKDGKSGAERCWDRIWNRQAWSSEGEEEMEAAENWHMPCPPTPPMSPPPCPPPAQNTQAEVPQMNVSVFRTVEVRPSADGRGYDVQCPCRSCETCREPGGLCPSRKCEHCMPTTLASIVAENDKRLLEHIHRNGTIN